MKPKPKLAAKPVVRSRNLASTKRKALASHDALAKLRRTLDERVEAGATTPSARGRLKRLADAALAMATDSKASRAALVKLGLRAAAKTRR